MEEHHNLHCMAPVQTKVVLPSINLPSEIPVNPLLGIYKTKNRRNKGGLRYVLPVVRFVYLVYSPSSSLPDYQVKQTAPRSFIVIRLVCKGVLYKHRDLRTCKPVHG